MPTEAWVEVEEAVNVLSIFGGPTVPRLSHGICERCESGLLDALENPSEVA